MYDLIIIGAGPAGLTAGIYAARSNLKTLIIEKESIGGQIASSYKVENFPGYKEISGMELANTMYEQAADLGCDLEVDEVIEIKDGPVKEVVCNFATFKCKSIIIATGAKYKTVGFENEISLIGKKVHFCVTCDGSFYKDKTVAVIGGGNSAVSNAIYLSSICKKVYLIVRKDYLKCDDFLKNNISNCKNIEVMYNSNVKKIYEDEDKADVCQKDKLKTINVDGVFDAIGVEPSTKAFASLIKIDDKNYFLSKDTITNKKGVYVAGDCRRKDAYQLTTAVSDGTVAALKAIDYIKETNY